MLTTKLLVSEGTKSIIINLVVKMKSPKVHCTLAQDIEITFICILLKNLESYIDHIYYTLIKRFSLVKNLDNEEFLKERAVLGIATSKTSKMSKISKKIGIDAKVALTSI